MAGKNFDISKFAATLKPVRSESDTMMEIPIEHIRDNPRNFYPAPDSAALRALMDSIRANGLLEPPTVIPGGDGQTYRLISGHSRLAAIKALRETETPDQWATVLCRVLPAMTEEQEQAAVIEANRQRVKSPALLADEAERLTKAYIKRREAGEDLPGRIRDRVAEALQVNATKVANVTAIKNGLKVPGIIERWKRDEIPEAAALMISRMNIDEQYRLLDWMIDKHRSYTINEVRKFDICYRNAYKCDKTGKPCENIERIYDHDLHHGEWSGAGCCMMCLKKDTCPAACKYVEKKPVEQPEAPAVNPAVADPRLDYKVMVPTFCQRVKELRIQTGMTRKEFAQSINEFPGTYSACENNSMCGSEKIAKLALCFGVSTDYLYGLTDELTPPTLPEGQLMIAGWMPGSTTPAEPGEFAAYVDLGDGKLLKRFFDWDGQRWLMSNGIEAQIVPSWWMRLPPVPAAAEKKGAGNG